MQAGYGGALMKILSHRGYWKTASEKNSLTAFERSFELDFGTETDIRDFQGELVIAHDIAMQGALSLKDFLTLATSYESPEPFTLALNIKADGLVEPLLPLLAQHPKLDMFAFDMSIPEMRRYLQAGIAVFSRMSEVEPSPVWLSQSAGVWLDGFEKTWFNVGVIEDLLALGKRVCVVSPELHGREHLDLWHSLKKMSGTSGLLLCTDFPEQARQFFANE